jgi:hypothetical protein
MKVKKYYSKDNLDVGFKMWFGFTYELHVINIDLDHKLCQLIKLSQKGVLNKHGVTYTIIKMSCTPTIGSIDCSTPSSNSTSVKYLQLLTHVIVSCAII